MSNIHLNCYYSPSLQNLLLFKVRSIIQVTWLVTTLFDSVHIRRSHHRVIVKLRFLFDNRLNYNDTL